MQFHIDVDTDEAVGGWLVPTRPDSPAAILIGGGGRRPIAFGANVDRPDLVSLGVHATGKAGFVVSPQTVPGLTSMDGLELRDADTGLLIYRKPQPDRDIGLKLVRFSQGLGVQQACDNVLKQHFNLAYPDCGEYPFTTLFGLFNNLHSKSIYASGALSFSRHFSLAAERNFMTMMFVRDPVQALAETLLTLREHLSALADTRYGEHFADWGRVGDPLQNDGALQAALGNLSDSQRQLLGNPLVRLLACQDEPPDHRHVATALDNLSAFNIVGVDREAAQFSEIFAELVGYDLLHTIPAPDLRVVEMAQRLSAMAEVQDLLALDAVVYDCVQSVAETA